MKESGKVLVNAEDCNAQICKGQVPHAELCDAPHTPMKTHHNDNNQVTCSSQIIINVAILKKCIRRSFIPKVSYRKSKG